MQLWGSNNDALGNARLSTPMSRLWAYNQLGTGLVQLTLEVRMRLPWVCMVSPNELDWLVLVRVLGWFYAI